MIEERYTLHTDEGVYETIMPKKHEVVEESCNHNYVHLETKKWSAKVSDYNSNRSYHRIDRFYCTKCLDTKEKRKDDWSCREEPDWY